MWLLIIAAVFAVSEWIFEDRKVRFGIYLTKPVVMLLLLIWIWFEGDFFALLARPESQGILWFALGLGFCLLGDIFLMGVERFFLPGLVSFLIGHIFYILGLQPQLPFINAENWLLLPLMAVTVIGLVVYRYLAKGMETSGKTRMKKPVALYALVISVMLYSAIGTFSSGGWKLGHALLVSIGAFLFYVSDIMNARSRFVGLFAHHRLWIMMSYHLAQFGLTVGAVLHFISI